MYVAMDQIVSIVAQSSYLYGGQVRVPVVLRANMIYGNSAAAQHVTALVSASRINSI
jgi:pyruvate/2-oxoglutarate/acetoin dehydrogenase E1 component